MLLNSARCSLLQTALSCSNSSILFRESSRFAGLDNAFLVICGLEKLSTFTLNFLTRSLMLFDLFLNFGDLEIPSSFSLFSSAIFSSKACWGKVFN